MKNTSFILLILLLSISVKSQVYWGLPYEEDSFSDSTLIILPPFDWNYSGHYSPTGIGKIKELMKFMYKFPEYNFHITLHTESGGSEYSIKAISKAQKERLNDYFEADSLVKKITYTITTAGSSNPLLSDACTSNSENDKYLFFLRRINARTEIIMLKK